jgi:hypothetical protein
MCSRGKLTRTEIFEVHKIGKLLAGRDVVATPKNHGAARNGELDLERPLIGRTLNLSLRLRP